MNPMLLSSQDCAKLLGIGKTLFYSMHSSGRLGPVPVKLGRRALWNKKEMEAWIDAGCPPRGSWIKTKIRQ